MGISVESPREADGGTCRAGSVSGQGAAGVRRRFGHGVPARRGPQLPRRAGSCSAGARGWRSARCSPGHAGRCRLQGLGCRAVALLSGVCGEALSLVPPQPPLCGTKGRSVAGSVYFCSLPAAPGPRKVVRPRLERARRRARCCHPVSKVRYCGSGGANARWRRVQELAAATR